MISGMATPLLKRRLQSVRQTRAAVGVDQESVASSLNALIALNNETIRRTEDEKEREMEGVDSMRVGELYLLANPCNLQQCYVPDTAISHIRSIFNLASPRLELKIHFSITCIIVFSFFY